MFVPLMPYHKNMGLLIIEQDLKPKAMPAAHKHNIRIFKMYNVDQNER